MAASSIPMAAVRAAPAAASLAALRFAAPRSMGFATNSGHEAAQRVLAADVNNVGAEVLRLVDSVDPQVRAPSQRLRALRCDQTHPLSACTAVRRDPQAVCRSGGSHARAIPSGELAGPPSLRTVSFLQVSCLETVSSYVPPAQGIPAVARAAAVTGIADPKFLQQLADAAVRAMPALSAADLCRCLQAHSGCLRRCAHAAAALAAGAARPRECRVHRSYLDDDAG